MAVNPVIKLPQTKAVVFKKEKKRKEEGKRERRKSKGGRKLGKAS